jgi:hypothetical protein
MFCLIMSATLHAEIVDRIAITVDSQVVTELQIDEELRVTAFLNHGPVVRDANSRRAAADRIVTQLLVRHEMQVSHYPEPSSTDVDKYLDSVRAGFQDSEEYERALNRYQVTEAALAQHLADQLAIMSFVELRFRPNLDIPEAEIRSYFDREMASLEREHPGRPVPSFDAERPQIVKILTEQHTDQILDIWLEEARKQVSIIYLDKALQ